MTLQHLSRFRIAPLLLNRYTVFLAGMLCYSLLLKSLGGLGGFSILNERLEIALVLYLYHYFNRIQRPSRWQAVLAAAPILLAYLGQDVYYLLYGKVFRLIELTEVPELLAVLPVSVLVLLAAGVVLPLTAFLYRIDYRRAGTLLAGSLPLLFLGTSVEFFPSAYARAFEHVGNEIVFWSDGASVENNGRLTMLLYQEAERQIARARTAAFRDRTEYDAEAHRLADWVAQHGTRRNVHLIVMESLLDPTLFRAARFTRDPIHPDFRKLFGNAQNFSVSPVFGGRTSQAEFEVLCGVPAFQELASVEFNAFTGAPAWCLPGILGQAGYRTIATNAYKPTFFNTLSAYQGIGFGEMYFPREFAGSARTYFSAGDVTGEKYMFDSVLFDQNVDFLSGILNSRDASPVFNYVLTIYGHMPHMINGHKRPERLKLVAGFFDPQLEREANQYYYRTQAIAAYVRNLIRLDRNSLIIIVSDHVPPLQYGPHTYQQLRYLDNGEDSVHMNRLLIVENGKFRKYPTLHHYDVPKLILNYITDGAYCREHDCGYLQDGMKQNRMALHDRYLRLMAHATEG